MLRVIGMNIINSECFTAWNCKAQILYTLNLMNTTSKFCTVTTFKIVDLYITLHTEFVHMVMFCPQNRFHISNSSLVIIIKPKTKYKLHAASVLFYTPQNNKTSIAPTSQVHVSTILLFLIVGS